MNKIRIVIHSFFLATLLATSFGSIQKVGAQTYRNTVEFNPSPCMFEIPAGLIEGEDIRCGYLLVPESRSNPESPRIQLAVAIVDSISDNPRPDPLFMEQGGPGGSTIDAFVQRLALGSELRSNRDIILLEQRGTLHSIPNLMCEELFQLSLDTLEQDISDDEYARLSLQAVEKCETRLKSQGIDLSSFDSLEIAGDIEDLRIALGYEEINLYGVSYGTLLALHFMRMYPGSLRSVILDGVLPPQTNYILETTQTFDKALMRLFEACRKDSDCDHYYPDLENVFFDLVQALNEIPAIIPMTDPDTGQSYDALIDGDSFLTSITLMLYASSIIPSLPRMIFDAKESEFDYFSRILTLIIFDRTLAYGVYYSVLCAEDADFSVEDQNLGGVNPVVLEIFSRGPKDFLDTCNIWSVAALDDSIDDAVVSNIPTLLLSGWFDPVTPEEYAQLATETLSQSYTVMIPSGGHGQAFEGKCQDQIILAFLENPSAPPDTSCIESSLKPFFYSPGNTIDIPVIIKLLNFDPGALIQFFFFALSTLSLSSAVLIIPLRFLILRLNNKKNELDMTVLDEVTPPKRSPIFVQLLGWFSFLLGVITPLFLIALIFTIVNMIMNNDNRLAYGLAGEARGWLLLPPAIFLLGSGLNIGAIQAWVGDGHSTSIWYRLYMSILAVSVIVCVVIFGIWHMLLAFL